MSAVWQGGRRVSIFYLHFLRAADTLPDMDIRRLRKDAGMTSDQVARAADITTDRYRRIERGDSKLLAAEIVPLAEALGVSIRVLLDQEA